MHKRRLALVLLVMFPILMGAIISPSMNPNVQDSIQDFYETVEGIDGKTGEVSSKNAFTTSQDTQDGILDPNIITQSGYQTGDVLRARTDSGHNARQNISIDESNNWKVSKSEVTVENLRKLYAVNGTFDDEVSPWTNSTYDPSGGDQTQFAIWNSTEGYVTCVNYGEYTDKPVQDDTYTHHVDSSIFWEQTVSNSPQTENFSLSFSYRYVSGPRDVEPYDFSGDVELRMYIHTDTYYLSIATGDERGVWYSITDYPIEITGAPSTFTVGIGIYVEYADIVLTENGDYDEDGSPDGLVNAEKIEVHLDNFEFKSRTPLPYEDVELTYDVEGTTEPITGPTGGIGTSTITNPTLWETDPLQIEITANSSVSFDYYVTNYFQRDINSSWTTGLSDYGVAYSIDAGQSADLELYTYVTSSSDYENLTLDIQFPGDWENTTILDPLQNDITGLCTITAGNIHVPNSLFNRVGWWKITHQSVNYAKSIDVQIYDTGAWISGSLFRPGNLTRTEVELGTATETPSSGSSVNIDWIMPNGSIWSADSVSSIVSGVVHSSSLTFGGTNTSAGLWEVQIFWNNGTELAYGTDTFDLYHQASATVKYPNIETDHGLVISNQIVLTDLDSGEYLLDDSVSMSANWSTTTVDFTQNFAKNWWFADFDTGLIENGQFTVIVSISRPYFDPIVTQFIVTSTFETSLTITTPGTGSAENDLFSAYTVELTYELWNGTGIEGALPAVSFTGPQEGIEWGSFSDIGNGLYSLGIISNISTSYEITITMYKPYHYNSSDSFTLTINEIETELILVNGTADVVQYGDSYRLVLEYRNSTGYGLADANLQIVTITPSTGLTNGSFTHITGGFYEVSFTPSTTGTYSIVIGAQLFNHETQYITFTLTGVVIPTTLTATPSSVSITVNQSFVVQLTFEDENTNPIDTATIELIDPPAGITVTTAIPIGNGLYNITVRSAEIDIYNLLFRALATNYQSAIVGFTVSVTAIPTVLEITNAGTIPVENGLNEIFTVQLSFEMLNGTGVPGAIPTFIFSGPAEGLSWYNFVDSNNGLYSIDIICNVSATYGISITMSKPFYYNTTDSFTLIIGETGSELEILNGTADVVLFGESYRLVVEYRNSTGYGLENATIEVVTITPGTGLTHANFSEISEGFYEITLTPSAAGTFSIVISADIVNHETQFVTFTLTASGIPTILTSLPSETTVAINQTFTLQLRFMDESFNPIDSAIITLLNPPVGLSVSGAIPAGSGYYNITLESSIIETFDLLFRATADNYQSSSAGFTFVVTEIQTSLSFAGDISSTEIEFAEAFDLILYYNTTHTGQAVQGAEITVLPAVANLAIVVTEYTGYYVVTIRGNGVGLWALSIIATRTDYRLASKSFIIEVVEIDTAIEGSSPLETLLIDREYDFTFSYIYESNSSYITGASMTPSGEAADWVTYVELGSGQYSVVLTPQELGEYSVSLTFSKVGFESASFRLIFAVDRIPISIEVLQGLSGPENAESIVSVSITETDTGDPVSGLQVFCYIINPIGDRMEESSIALTETTTAGVYNGVIPMPVAEGEYQLEISCEGAHYVMNSEFKENLTPSRSLATMLWVTTTRYYPLIIALAGVVVGLAYRRASRKKRIHENKTTLAIKRRFDDIKSMLGVIVLHKESGLPVYSKILREGLEETVISAFITAITSFRGEFDIETSSEEWGLIPISDIVRVISTNKLVCAFITTGNPSPEQRERMIQFAKTVGFIFDETMEDVPVVVLDHHTTQQFDALFEDILDGQLLRTFKLDESKKFPTTSCANERIARKKGVEFKLEELATEISACGLEEGRVYRAIMTALENHYLVTTEDSPFSTELLRAPDPVEDTS